MQLEQLYVRFPYLQKLAPISTNIVETLHAKEQAYGGSWKKRGGVGAFMMLARKWDRIENIANEHGYDLFEAIDANDGDVVDDIDDLIGYLLLCRADRKLEQQRLSSAVPKSVEE